MEEFRGLEELSFPISILFFDMWFLNLRPNSMSLYLFQFPALDRGALKMSGIGRSIMLLYKHPKETRENRNLAGKIIGRSSLLTSF